MESLPFEIFLHILTYLPGEDITRLKRVNRSFGKIIKQNKTRLAKPMVSFVVESDHNCKTTYAKGHFSIFTPQFLVRVAFSKNGILTEKKVGNNKELARCFLRPFKSIGYKKKNITQREAFLKWLFRKVDIQSFEMTFFTGYEEVCDLVLNAMKGTNVRCFKMLMKFSYRFIITTPGGIPWKFFPDFCRIQTQLKVPLKLEIDTEAKDVLSSSPDVDWLHKYCAWFPKVLCKFHSIWIFDSLFAICSRWLNGDNLDLEKLDLIKFRLCFTYTEPDVDQLNRVRKFDDVLNMDIQLVNINEEVFRNLVDFSSLPEEIVFEKKTTREKLQFKITKVDNCAFIDCLIL